MTNRPALAGAGLPLLAFACVPSSVSLDWPFEQPAGTFISVARSHETESFFVSPDAGARALGPELELTVASFRERPAELGFASGPLTPSANGCELPQAVEVFSYSERQGWQRSPDLAAIGTIKRPCPDDPCVELHPRILSLQEAGAVTLAAPLDERRAFLVNLARTSCTSAGFAYVFEAPDQVRPLGPTYPVWKSAARGESVFANIDDGTATGPTYRFDLKQISEAIDHGTSIEAELVSDRTERFEAMVTSPVSEPLEVFALNGDGTLFELSDSVWRVVGSSPALPWSRRGMVWLEPGTIVQAPYEIDTDPTLRSRTRNEPLSIPRTPGSQIWAILTAPGLGPVVTTFHPNVAEILDLRARRKLWSAPSTFLEFERYRGVASSDGLTIAVGHQLVLEFVKVLPPIGSSDVCPLRPLTQAMRWENALPLGGGFLVTGGTYASTKVAELAFVRVE
ncbi:MAG: hypothetical protein HY791_29105 [Deltaproteobacteria bacterium]|nr:hypothetical protein [Deltaproteobacteria bacterium]